MATHRLLGTSAKVTVGGQPRGMMAAWVGMIYDGAGGRVFADVAVQANVLRRPRDVHAEWLEEGGLGPVGGRLDIHARTAVFLARSYGISGVSALERIARHELRSGLPNPSATVVQQLEDWRLNLPAPLAVTGNPDLDEASRHGGRGRAPWYEGPGGGRARTPSRRAQTPGRPRPSQQGQPPPPPPQRPAVGPSPRVGAGPLPLATPPGIVVAATVPAPVPLPQGLLTAVGAPPPADAPHPWDAYQPSVTAAPAAAPPNAWPFGAEPVAPKFPPAVLGDNPQTPSLGR